MNQPKALPAAAPDTVNRFIAVVLEDLKSKTLKLPTLPEVATKVRQAVEDENTSTAQVARMIAMDVALSARLIQVANSALYRGRTYIDSVQLAVTRLGNKTVRDLVTSLIMQQIFQAKTPRLRKRLQTLWLHGTNVAAISGMLARRYTSLSADEALLAGLLHDIGALPLLVRVEDFPELANDEQAIDQVIENMHTSIGKLILETWQFPAELIAVAAEHEDLGRYSATVDYVDVVMVANLLSYAGTGHRHAQVDWGGVPAFGKIGITPEESLALLEETKTDLADLKKLLGG